MNFIEMDRVVVSLYAALLSIDLLTGVLKAVRLGRKPTSKKFLIGIMAKLTFLLIPIILAIAAKAVGVNLKVFVTTVINALVLNEVYSSIANIYTIQTAKETAEFDVLGKILKFIRNYIDRMLNDKDIS